MLSCYVTKTSLYSFPPFSVSKHSIIQKLLYFSMECSSSSNITAMLFSSQSIGSLKELSVIWEDRKESHKQVLVHGLTQLTIVNATVTHYRYK